MLFLHRRERDPKGTLVVGPNPLAQWSTSIRGSLPSLAGGMEDSGHRTATAVLCLAFYIETRQVGRQQRGLSKMERVGE